MGKEDRTMKKAYISPEVRVNALSSATMVAASILNPSDSTPTITLTDDEYHETFSTHAYVYDTGDYEDWEGDIFDDATW